MQHGSFLCTPRSSQWPVFDDFDAISRLAPGDLAFVKRSTDKLQPAFVVETSAAQMSIKFLVDDKHTKRFLQISGRDSFTLQKQIDNEVFQKDGQGN